MNNPRISNNRIFYQVALPRLDEEVYTVQVHINNGRCRDRSDSIEDGDYFNDYSYSFEVTAGVGEIQRDIGLIKYAGNK